MQLLKAGTPVRAAFAAGTLGLAMALPLYPAQAKAKIYQMKISTPTLHDIPNAWIAGFVAMLKKDSGGRLQIKVYPASQLGAIPRQIEGTQFGSIQCEVVPPVFYVGLDPRFQLLAAPGLVGSRAQGRRVALNPAVRNLILNLAAKKGLHGVGLFFAEPNVMVSRVPLPHLADFKGKKIRIFASPFEVAAFRRLGMTPVAMTLGDVVPALQEGTIDASITGMGPVVKFHMVDAAKYVTLTNQPAIFISAMVNTKWYNSLPKDLQHIIDRDGAKEDVAINSVAAKMHAAYLKEWKAAGGTLFKLPPDEYARMMKILASVGTDVSRKNPVLAGAYKLVTAAATGAPAATH